MSKNEEEVSEYLDGLLRYGGKSSEKLYEDILRSLSMLDAKISTLIDKIDAWMKIIGQKRLDDYKLGKNIERLMNMAESTLTMINRIKDSGRNVPKATDELSFLNSLVKDYSEVHYRVEDGLVSVRLRKGIEPNRFKKLNKMLRGRGYVYDGKMFRWVKSLL